MRLLKQVVHAEDGSDALPIWLLPKPALKGYLYAYCPMPMTYMHMPMMPPMRRLTVPLKKKGWSCDWRSELRVQHPHHHGPWPLLAGQVALRTKT